MWLMVEVISEGSAFCNISLQKSPFTLFTPIVWQLSLTRKNPPVSYMIPQYNEDFFTRKSLAISLLVVGNFSSKTRYPLIKDLGFFLAAIAVFAIFSQSKCLHFYVILARIVCFKFREWKSNGKLQYFICSYWIIQKS